MSRSSARPGSCWTRCSPSSILTAPNAISQTLSNAARRLIDTNYRITREHGTWINRQGTWMTAIYHPSALLRDPARRPETFDDLLSIRSKLQELHIQL